jgi:3-hydroxyacyl-CoA dehydrogenase / enoyl-CoA hydratase / 3-hydroxybutyryl-CoA epimerase
VASHPPDGAPFRLEPGDEGVALLVFDAPGAVVNLVTHGALEALDRVLQEVEVRAAAGELRALVLASGKRAFSPGADLDEVGALPSAEAAAAHARRGQQVLRRLERLEIPTVAALHGACLGAGAELALACAYRVAADAPGTRIGFPEVAFGLLPVLGGIVRLPRLVGVGAALGMMLEAKPLTAAEALEAGLVDALLPDARFHAAAAAFALERARHGRRRTGARRGLARRLVEETAPGRRALLLRARRDAARDGRLSPAAAVTLEAVADVLALPLDAAFERAAEVFGRLSAAPESRGMLHAGAVLRAHRRSLRGVEPAGFRLDQVALLGGGALAGGLAYRLARASVSVRVRDPRRPLAEAALRAARACAEWERARGTLAAPAAERTLDRIAAGRGYGGFGAVQLVISLPGADREAALAEAMEHVGEGALAAWGGAAAAPDEALSELPGIRFFPAPAEPRLAEVVRPEEPDAARAAGILALLARRMEALPLPLSPETGTVAGRLLLAYAGEAVRAAAEGIAEGTVERALHDYGMLAPPLALAEAADHERLVGVVSTLSPAASAALEADTLVPLLRQRADLAAQRRRRPRRGRRPRRAAAAEGEAVAERVVLALLAEAARLVDEGVDAATVELAARFGVGFPPARGGVLFAIDRRGAAAVAAALEAHAARYGPRFAPAPVLARLAAEGRGFHAAGVEGRGRGAAVLDSGGGP